MEKEILNLYITTKEALYADNPCLSSLPRQAAQQILQALKEGYEVEVNDIPLTKNDLRQLEMMLCL